MSATASNVNDDKSTMPVWAVVILTAIISVLVTLGMTSGFFKNLIIGFVTKTFTWTVPLWVITIVTVTLAYMVWRDVKKNKSENNDHLEVNR